MTDSFHDIDVEASDALPSAFAALAADLKDRVIPLQNESGKDWKEIRMELWLDSGRIIAFPAQNPYTDRIDVAGCTVHCTAFEEAIEELSDDDFDAEMNKMQEETAGLITKTVGPLLDCPIAIYDADGERVS